MLQLQVNLCIADNPHFGTSQADSPQQVTKTVTCCVSSDQRLCDVDATKPIEATTTLGRETLTIQLASMVKLVGFS